MSRWESTRISTKIKIFTFTFRKVRRRKTDLPAGVTMCTSMVSALTNTPVRRDLAMTGEITLRGKVLPVGGIKEKVIAAHRAGVKKVLLPRENMEDIDELPQNVRHDLEFRAIDTIDEVLEEALVTVA